jgi:hypothetical protein
VDRLAMFRGGCARITACDGGTIPEEELRPLNSFVRVALIGLAAPGAK